MKKNKKTQNASAKHNSVNNGKDNNSWEAIMVQNGLVNRKIIENMGPIKDFAEKLERNNPQYSRKRCMAGAIFLFVSTAIDMLIPSGTASKSDLHEIVQEFCEIMYTYYKEGILSEKELLLIYHEYANPSFDKINRLAA